MKLPKIIFILLFFASISNASTFAIGKGIIMVDERVFTELSKAFAAAKNGSIIKLGPGRYHDAGILAANNIQVIGSKGTHIYGKATEGKAAIVVKGNNTIIRNIECSHIKVAANNGACIRAEGHNIKLSNVYIHDTQMGILTGKHPGRVIIEESQFKHIGYHNPTENVGHAIYVNGGRLVILNSKILASKGEGHEVKSRAALTTISNSTIATLNGVDSRLLDIPNGGILKIENSILQQGQNSANGQLIGFGLEGVKYGNNLLIMKNNLILMERSSGNTLLKKANQIKNIMIKNNIIVGHGKTRYPDNTYYPSRRSANLPPYPQLPSKLPNRIVKQPGSAKL